jgi:hypothetical protein
MSDHHPQEQPGAPAGPIRWSQASWPAPSDSVQTTIDQMTDQLQTVIGAAERAAEAIRRDAEEQARRHLAEAQRKADRMTAERVGLISELTDDLIRHAANVRDHSEQMVRALEDAIDSVTGKLEQPGLSEQLDIGAAAPAIPSPPPEVAERRPPPQPAVAQQRPVESPPAAQPPAPMPSGTYTDIVGAPPPPPPAAAPAPLPPVPERHDIAVGPPQPTPEAAAAAAAAGVPPGPAGPVAGPDEPGPAVATGSGSTAGAAPANADGPEHVAQALDHARRLADAGTDRETIASVLRQLWGVSDPDPIVDRVLGGR